MRILLAGGGSGGHIFPLIAVVRQLKKMNGFEFLFAGPAAQYRKALNEEGIEVKSIFAPKIRRYFSLLNFLSLLYLPLALLQAYRHVFFFMPDVVFSKGGYGSLPVVLVSWLFRVPIIIHESDVVPGAANKILARFAKVIAVSFPETTEFFPEEKTFAFGNPVREELFFSSAENALKKLSVQSQRPVVFIVGGSRGAEQINDLVFLVLPDILEKYEVIHQCGEANYEKMRKAADFRIKKKEKKAFYHLYPSFTEEEMASAYKSADVIVSRAGSGAIFEIAMSGKPGILIPYIHAAADHQEKNAHSYAKTGAATILEGRNITPHILTNSVDSIISNTKKWRAMSDAARNFAKPRAAREIAELIVKNAQND